MRKFVLLLFFFSLFYPIPLVFADSMPGARSATNSSGDVFLGGNYIEVGISKGGSFGTSSSAPESFHSHATSKNNYRVGLLSDGDGWDVGNPPTMGDFFLPGTPEERYILSYKIDGVTYENNQADRMDVFWPNPIQALEVRDESNIRKGLLKATVTGITRENVKLVLSYYFDVNDKYYLVDANLENLSNNVLTDVRFVRSFDPDQDVELYSTHHTYDKVICNPDPTRRGSDSNYALVVARGEKSLEGFFFVAFDNRARASRGVAFSPTSAYLDGFWNETTPGLPTQSSEDAIRMTLSDLNGYVREDSSIALTFNFGTMKGGEKAKFSFSSSLNPNVEESLEQVLKAVAADVKNRTDHMIEVELQDGYEYSIDKGKTWQSVGTFDGLKENTEYVIWSRIKATDSLEASSPEEIKVKTKKSGPVTPNINLLGVTEDTLIVQEYENYEYSIDNGDTWQTSPIFNDLSPNKDYVVISRYVEGEDIMYGRPTVPISTHTLDKIISPLEELSNVTIELDVENDVPTVYVNKNAIYNSVKNDVDFLTLMEEEKNIRIVLSFKRFFPTDADKKELFSHFEDNEEFAYSIDVSMQLYVDGDDYVKDITEVDESLEFQIDILDQFLDKKDFSVFSFYLDSDNKYVYERLDRDLNTKTITISMNELFYYGFSYFSIIENPPTSAHMLLIIMFLYMLNVLLFYFEYRRKKNN